MQLETRQREEDGGGFGGDGIEVPICQPPFEAGLSCIG